MTGRAGWKVKLGLLVACACVLAGWSAAAAGALSLASTGQPLPGSQFQGGDGNQADTPGLIDWQGLQADGRVFHTSDPQASDNIFKGGSKELDPGGWGLATQNGGANPASLNVLDVYRAIDRPPGGDVFLYLAFTREASNGTIFVTFELNQDARTWRNPQGATIPCRTTGDLLIAFDEHGNATDVAIDRWVTDTSDAATGCAKTGHLETASSLTPNVDVQGSFNDLAAITNYLPGFYAGSVPQLRFGEAAINLTKVLSDLGHPCTVFGSTWMHSRSSLSATADMKDYVAPEPFAVRTCRASPHLTTVASGATTPLRLRAVSASPALSDTAHLTEGDNPTGSLAFHLYGPHDPHCSRAPVFTSTATVLGNGDYASGAFTPTRAGTYRWVAGYSGDAQNHGVQTSCGEHAETVVVSRATPALHSTASGSGHGHGRTQTAQPIHDTAELTGGFTPTGTITFRLYGPHQRDCSGPPLFTSRVEVDGNGAYTSEPFTPDAAGTYRWVVSYSGDENNHPAAPTACGIDSETVVLEPAHPHLSTVASGAVDLGHPISDAATLTGGAHPTGRITFRAYGPHRRSCSGPPAHTSTVAVSGNDTYRSRPFTPGAAGIYRWVATYSGDGNNTPAGPTACHDPAEAVVVAHPVAQPHLSSTASAAGPAGSPVHDTAHLSSGSRPTGTLTFEVSGPGDRSCSGAPVAILTTTVSGNGDYPSPPFRPVRAGTYRWMVRYSGDRRNHPAGPTACADAAETVTMGRAQPSLRTLAVGLVPLGATARDRGLLARGSHPRGLITFRLYGPDDPSCSRPPVFVTRAVVVGNGVYGSSRFAPRQSGTYRWVATYSGDVNNRAATTRCGDRSEQLVVPLRRPRLTTSASPRTNVHRRARPVQTAGLSIYDAAVLRLGFAPTGQITFQLFGPNDPGCTGPPRFTSAVTVNGNGVYNSEHFIPTASGTYRWVATYSGDAGNRATGPTRCGIPAEQVHVTVPAVPQLTTSASAAITLGGAIYDTAHLTGGAAPAGTITFRLYGPGDTTCARAAVFTSAVPVNGNNDYTSPSFVPTGSGVYRWVAHYSGDAANHPAQTACGDSGETAVVRAPDITPVVPALSSTASQQPPLGATLSDTAHLTGGEDPGGAITFALFGPDHNGCVGAPLFTATAAVDGSGDYRSPAFVVPAPGTYRWVVTYSGDALNAAVGPTACGDPAETVTVTPAPSPETGPNVPTPPRTGPAHRVVPPQPPPPPPAVTG